MLYFLRAQQMLSRLVCVGVMLSGFTVFAQAEDSTEGFVPPSTDAVNEAARQAGAAGDLNDTTVTYPADFFAQYEPISARDMLDRIPGIDSILGGNNGNDDRRGLGAGDDQILINGKRIAGKENDGRTVLGQIAATQVNHIEIIRGNSLDLDIRAAGPIVNVVLRDDASKATVTAEINADYYQQDSNVQPGGLVSINGRGDTINYLATIEAEPRYQQEFRNETSVLGDGSAKDRTRENRVRDQLDYKLSTTLGLQLSQDHLLQLNGLFEKTDPPRTVDRNFTVFDPNDVRTSFVGVGGSYQHRERNDAEQHKWEFGLNYAYDLGGGSQFKLIGIINEEIDSSLLERFSNLSGSFSKILFINDQRRERERIIRTSFHRPLTDSLDLEVGVEAAETTLDTNFILATTSDGWTPSPRYGNLNGNSDEESEVKEERYEPFVVLNWRPATDVTVEGSLVAEYSDISLDGFRFVDSAVPGVPQVSPTFQQDDYRYLKPKVDIRYDINPQLQLRATINRDISQLDFRDYTTRQDGSDVDSNLDVGNPELVQEKTWQYELDLEYRLPNDGGVLEGRVYYHDIEDVIERVDVSFTQLNEGTNEQELVIASAPGNIGDGTAMGLELNASLRLGFWGLPEALLSGGVLLQDSDVKIPFTNENRRRGGNSRGNWNLEFRHDITQWNMNYGFTYRYFMRGSRRIDVDDIRDFERDPGSSVFVEKVAFNGIRFRFDVMNALDGSRCLQRTRYDGLTADGIVEEIENSCVSPGRKFAIKIRTTF